MLDALSRVRPPATITIVSNAWPDIRTGLTAAGVSDLADSIVLSCEVGYAKPDPHIYELALHSVHATPADALFVDDAPGHVDAARSVGMSAHLHTDRAETLARIESFLEGAPASLQI